MLESAEVPVLVSFCWFLLTMVRSGAWTGALVMSALLRLATTLWSPRIFGTLS